MSKFVSVHNCQNVVHFLPASCRLSLYRTRSIIGHPSSRTRTHTQWCRKMGNRRVIKDKMIKKWENPEAEYIEEEKKAVYKPNIESILCTVSV